MNFVFDVDGTLTPSRLPINENFQKTFLSWMEGKKVYFLTGSDKDKTIEQVGKEIWDKCTRAYQCAGNAVYENGKLIRQSDFQLTTKLENILNTQLHRSPWQDKYSNHIEERVGLVNFSIIGRDCPQEAREAYYAWDTDYKEREQICKHIEYMIPELEAAVGGEISIDIYPKGKNKAQILEDLEGPVIFFGDKCKEGGNDYPVVKALQEQSELPFVINDVVDWRDTYRRLSLNADMWTSLLTYGNQ